MGFADTYIALKEQAADNLALAITMQYADQPEAAAIVQQLRAAAIRSEAGRRGGGRRDRDRAERRLSRCSTSLCS